MIVSHSALAFLQGSYKDAMRFLIELQLEWFTTCLYLWHRGELNSVASGGCCHFPTLCSWVLERLCSLWLNWVVVQFLRKIRILQSTDPNNWWTDQTITHNLRLIRRASTSMRSSGLHTLNKIIVREAVRHWQDICIQVLQKRRRWPWRCLKLPLDDMDPKTGGHGDLSNMKPPQSTELVLCTALVHNMHHQQ